MLIISPAFLEAFYRRVSVTTVAIGGISAGTYVHSVSASRLLAGVTLSKTPVDGVGKSVFLQVGQELLVDLESREVFWKRRQ